MNHAALPSAELLHRQAAWLASARARLLRRAAVARRHSILDLACGRGAVTDELVHRGAGSVVALDCSQNALAEVASRCATGAVVRGNAEQLPLADGAFDLVFCQFALLWLDAPAVTQEIRRVLMPDGVLVAIEPDYGGLIEHPPEIATRDLWLAGLSRAGADPCMGRKLPGILAAAGFDVHVDLLDHLVPPSRLRFDMLGELPLNDEESRRLQQVVRADVLLPNASRVVHLPIFLILAEPK